ncbi:oligomeric golgi complex component, COG2-domain-containing protein [Halteromyces radiatus]|uniref:oligomeric golgi complex component, COG2-domain-containing protein n=1 Tax=Halteromyces radiatus TaxID=101107 RepID=UPI00221EA413|nr:oligomeric golgi complex component, COG2-domain-containing protein [Halteromyces radiatus]KAI8086471.1 oligomeric golgi complex component, COG2-domain-containing protein [Halteromyces radiatus]
MVPLHVTILIILNESMNAATNRIMIGIEQQLITGFSPAPFRCSCTLIDEGRNNNKMSAYFDAVIMFSFGDEDDDDTFIQSIQPLPKQTIERDIFTAEEFDPDRFLSSRRHLGLERLKMELNSHLKSLKTELVDLINRDYQDFINLSTNLKGVDKAIENLQPPLVRMEVEVKGVRSHFQHVMDDLEKQLEHRARVREKKTCLKLLLNIHESVSKVEDLLQINADISKDKAGTGLTMATTLTDGTTVAEETEDSLGKQIDRVAVEFNQMQHLVNRGKHLSFVIENEWRITRIKDTLQQKLSKALSMTINNMLHGQIDRSTRQALTQCLRTYALVDQTHVAESIIREEFIRPFLDKTITRQAIESPRLNNNGSSSTLSAQDLSQPLVIMYNKILSFASNDLRPILDISQRTLKGTNYEILVNSLWVQVVEHIHKRCSTIYAAGQTDACHRNYTSSIQFISGLENLFISKKSLLYFRNHPSYTLFMKRWQLPVYFQLRFREIVTDVEEHLVDSKKGLALDTSKSPTNKTNLVLPGTKAIAQAIEKCWADNVFLYLLCRYNLWATQVIEQTFNKQDDRNDGEQRTSSSLGSSPTTSGDLIKPFDETLVIVLSNDIENLVSVMKTLTSDMIFPKLPNDIQDISLLKESMDELLQTLETSTIQDLDRRITGAISRRCMESLQLVKGIISHYRHTNKAPPTEPSYFIPHLFKPFVTFVERNRPWIQHTNKQKTWAAIVIDMVIFRYTLIISELLAILKKQDDALKKIKWGKKTGLTKPSEDTLTDSEKIQLQFALDVRQIGKELDKMDVENHRPECYIKLCQVVEPFEHLISSPV